jgi:hypothetical protein
LVIVKIICLILFDENEKYNFDEIEVKNDLWKIERESIQVEKENNVKNNDMDKTDKGN